MKTKGANKQKRYGKKKIRRKRGAALSFAKQRGLQMKNEKGERKMRPKKKRKKRRKYLGEKKIKGKINGPMEGGNFCKH